MDQFFSSHNFFLAEIIFKHKSVHRSIKFNFFIGLSFEFIFCSEDLDNLFRKILICVFCKIVLIYMLTYFKIKLNILNIAELFFVLSHSAANKTMFMKFFFDSIFWENKGVDSLMNFRVRIVVVKLLLNSFLGHFSCKLNRSHVRKPLFLGLFRPEDHLV